jgi:glycine/D-amino acid oxidase-like deaminating enzyme
MSPNDAQRLSGCATIWDVAPPSRQRDCPLTDFRVGTAVIGGGLAGLSAAYHLAKSRDHAGEVALFEATRLGGGASGRTTGMLTPGIGQDPAGLIKRCGLARARTLYAGTLAAVDYVHELAALEGIDCQLRSTGQLIVAHGSSGSGRLRQYSDALTALQVEHSALDAGELEAALMLGADFRAATTRGGPAALRLPRAGLLHPGMLVQGLARAVERHGAKIYEGARVVALKGRGPVRIHLDNGVVVEANKVVVATDAYAPELTGLRGRVLPLHLRVLATAPLTASQRRMIGWAGREAVIDSRRLFNYFRLTEDDRIVFGGGSPQYAWGGNTDAIARDGAAPDDLVRELQHAFPFDLEVTSSWTGVIGLVLDALPIVGPTAHNPDVVYVGGWCGHGIALSVSSGRWIADLLAVGAESGPSAVWQRSAPASVPTEAARWVGARTAIWSKSVLDRF